jgi:hypothetical protein
MEEGPDKPFAGFDAPKLHSAAGIQTWKVFVFLFALIAFLIIASAIICGTDSKCTHNIPTVKNMLNSTMSTPFIVSGLNAALGVHLVTSTFLYWTTTVKAPYWSSLQMISAIIMYATCIITLFVLPFTSWQNNWANVATLVALVFWMVFVQISLKRNRKSVVVLFTVMLLYMVCVLIYIIVRAVPDIPPEGRDVGILVVELIGGLAITAFMFVCITHIYNMKIHVVTNSVNE